MDYSRLDWEVLDYAKSPAEIAEAARFLAQSGVGGVCVPPFMVKTVAQSLQEFKTHTVASLGDEGLSKSTVKAIEAVSCIKDGATRVEVPINLSHVIRTDWDSIHSELLEIARAARAAKSDVILCAGYLSASLHERDALAQIVVKSAFDEMLCRILPSRRESARSYWQPPQGLLLKYSTMHSQFPRHWKIATSLIKEYAPKPPNPDELFAVGAHRVGVATMIPDP